MPRLERINGDFFHYDEGRYEAETVVWIKDALERSAQTGAMLVEIRFRPDNALAPGFMAMFREAERDVQKRYPDFCAEAIVSLWVGRPATSEHLEACLRARREGLAGIDLIPLPYETETDWTEAYRWADRAHEAGLGITAHAGEFSSANVRAALGTPGLTRIGHAVHAAYEPDLLEQMAKSGVTVECCLTSNVVLGAVGSLESHPIGRFARAGVPVTLNTDNPLRMCTSIGGEYEMAGSLGFTREDLLAITRQGILASFTTESRKTQLLAALDGAE